MPENKKGMTLIEILITITMLVMLMGVSVYVFRAILINWSLLESRSGIAVNLDSAMAKMLRDFRTAKEVQSTTGYHEIRFSPDEVNFYVYYLYNESDSYAPPPEFDMQYYQLRKATLSGGINGTFTYGSGQLILTDVLPPPDSELSINDNIITIDLMAERKGETKRLRTEVRPRNI